MTALAHLLLQPVQDGPHETPQWVDKGIPFLSVDGVVDNHLSFSGCRYVSPEAHAEYSRKSKPQQGDVLLTKAASIGKVAVVETDAEFNVWSPLAILRPDPIALDSKFLYFVLQSTACQDQLQTSSTKNTQQNVAMSDIAALRIPNLPLANQHAIADYLDRETARIDALIAAKQRMIKLLEERERVTRSLIVSSSTDGTPYPRIRLKFLSPHIGVGVVVNPSNYFSDQGVPFLHGSHITESGIIFEPRKYMSAMDNAKLPVSRLTTGDVVVVRAGYPGRAATIPPEFNNANCASIIIVRKSRKIISDFLAEFLNSEDGSRQVALVQYGAAQEQINVSHIVDFMIPCPALPEQRAALEHIKRACGPLYEARQRLFQQIKLLQEHRQALVTAVVTGQLDIPEAV